MAGANQHFLVIFFILGLCVSQVISRTLTPVSMSERHDQWMAQHGRVYKDDIEKERRFNIFKNNVEYIEAANNVGGRKYKLSINEFADLSNEEFKATRNGFRPSVHSSMEKVVSTFKYENVADVPPNLDWRSEGAVTPVKDQGECGCCWAFSAVAATEGLTQLSTGKLISLSVQQLVDCDTSSQDQGCNGGLIDDAFQFIIDNKGITTEANYPYKEADGSCNSVKAAFHAASISSYEDVPSNDEASLKNALSRQPISVAIDAGGSDFQFYSSGVFTGACGTNLDHGVAAVGYGTDSDGTKYWLVKNSWGASWGENGYIRMQRDIDAQEGLCGIAMRASYPIA